MRSPSLGAGIAVAGCWLLGTAGGVASAGLQTEPGRDVVVQAVLTAADSALQGSLKVGEVSGSFVGGLDIRNVVIRGDDGAVLADIPRLQLRYGLPDLLRGRIVLGKLTLSSPTINLVQHRGRRLNLEEIFGLGGTGEGGPGPLVAFRDVEILDGTLVVQTPTDRTDRDDIEIEDGPSGPRRVHRFTQIDAHLTYVRLASPLPNEDGVRIDVAELSAAISDPSLELTGVRGRVEIRGDSIILDLDEIRFPDTQARVRGTLDVTADALMVDLDVLAEVVATDQVRSLVPTLPAGMSGSGRIIVRSVSSSVLEFDSQLAMRGLDEGGEARGRLSMVLGPGNDWAFRDTDLDLEDFDLEYVRAFFDTLPIAGRITGRFQADGPRDRLLLGLAVEFRDSLVSGWPVTTLEASGIVSLEGPEIVFRDYELLDATLDLRTVRRLLPGVDLQGFIVGSGRLNGPWLEVAFDGDLGHFDDPLFHTHARGAVRIDARGDTLGVWSQLVFDSLKLDGFHSSYPNLGIGGSFVGRASIGGYLDSLLIDADLEGPAGAVFVDGALVLLPERRGAYGLDLRVARFDLARLSGRLPTTRLFGRLQGSGISDSHAGPWARASAVLRTSTVAGIVLDSVRAAMVVQDSMLWLDTLRFWGPALRASGSGEVGLWTSRDGTITLSAVTDSIGVVDPLLARLLGSISATGMASDRPSGSLRLNLKLEGALSDYELSGDLSGSDIDRGAMYVPRVRGEGSWRNSSGAIRLAGTADSLDLGGWGFADLRLQLDGSLDSLSWEARTRFGDDGYGAWIAGGRLIAEPGRYRIPLDSMGFLLAGGAWFVDHPTVVQVSDSGIDFSRTVVASVGGAGRITVDGRLPFAGSGSLFASVEALPVQDLWMLLQRNYRAVAGDLSGTLTLGGAARAPTIALSMALIDGEFGEFRAPALRGTLDYQERQLVGEFGLWRRGDQILSVDVQLPIDLALRGVERRRIPGQISLRAVADGVDLSFVDAMTASVRNAAGTLDANFGIAGTWERPELTGRIEIADGVGTFPALGVQYEDLRGGFRLSGDTIAIEHLSMGSGDGVAEIAGFVRLEELTRPVLDLRIAAREFHAVDVRDFLSLTASGNVELRGPVFNATLTGEGTVTQGVLYFADLITKEIVNLEATPAFADPTLILDTTLIRREGLGAEFENRFLDSLRIDSLRLEMVSNTWMRSSEANIELLGVVTVDKDPRERDQQYRLNGTLETPRGTYRLSLGPSFARDLVTREFTVTRGEVTYFGTPSLDAAIDIDARHRVRSVRGEDFTVSVHFGGTIYEPRLTFSSDIRPPISEPEILSYLFFGAPSAGAFAGTGGSGNQRLAEQGLSQFLGALSGQLEYSLISDLRVPLDYVQIRPTVAGTGLSGTEIALGKRLGERWFLTVSPRLCPREQFFENVGASLEYRFTRAWFFSVSGDPVRSCAAFRTQSLLTYQLGVDLFWEKRY